MFYINDNYQKYSIFCFSTSWNLEALELVPAAEQAAKVARRVEAVVAEITRVSVLQVKIKTYDKWGCPGAIREIRGVLESLSYCSRTSSTIVMLLLNGTCFAALLYSYITQSA